MNWPAAKAVRRALRIVERFADEPAVEVGMVAWIPRGEQDPRLDNGWRAASGCDCFVMAKR